MKRTSLNLSSFILTALFVTTVMVLFGQVPAAGTGQVKIKGKIAGLASGTATLTTEVFGQKQNFNATIAQGLFEFAVNQPSPTLYSMTINEDPSGRLIFFADNG